MILCLIKLMSGSNVPGIDQNEQAVCVLYMYVIRLQRLQSLYEQLIATNCRVSNKIMVFLFHIVIKKITFSPFYKNEEAKTINTYFIDVCFIFESLS